MYLYLVALFAAHARMRLRAGVLRRAVSQSGAVPLPREGGVVNTDAALLPACGCRAAPRGLARRVVACYGGAGDMIEFGLKTQIKLCSARCVRSLLPS